MLAELEKNIVAYGQSLSENLIDVFSDLLGMKFEQVDAPMKLSQINTSFRMGIIVPFVGTVTGDFCLFYEDSLWQGLMKDFAFESNEEPMDVSVLLEEGLNLAASKTISTLKDNFGDGSSARTV